MADASDQRAKTRAAVAYICANKEKIREALGSIGDETPLDELLVAVAESKDLVDPIKRLHGHLVAGSDAAGIYGHVRSKDPRPAGVGEPAETLYLCPAGRCSRTWWPGRTTVPDCAIDGQKLRRERL